jgi:bidirectional [NiFe] hydrogenase diaphorase subunit
MVAKANSATKYVICNADEGDPGAFMDRSVLESDPHRVLEGMAIAAYAVGADRRLHLCPLGISAGGQAAESRHPPGGQQGFWAATSSARPFSFKIEIRLGAGAFVCGEETALIASIAGQRGQPRPRPRSRPNPGFGARPR